MDSSRWSLTLAGCLVLSACSFEHGLDQCQDAGRCPGAPGSASTVTASPEAALADGRSAVDVVVRLRDAAGAPVRGQLVTLDYARRTPWVAWTDPSGLAVFSLTSVEPWEGAVTVLLDGARPLDQQAPVRFLPEWRAVAAGREQTVAVKGDGSLWAWGANTSGQLGDGSGVEQPRPVRLAQPTPASVTAGGDGVSAALGGDGSVWCWGTGSWMSAPVLAPKQLAARGASGFTALTGGAHHFLALHPDDGGTVWAWGSSGEGRLGDGTSASRLSPAPVEPMRDVVAVAAGRAHSLALQRDGGLWAWGTNGSGQLGTGAAAWAALPVPLEADGVAFVAVAAGDAHSLAVARDGSLWAWGDNSSSQLGLAVTLTRTPKQVSVPGAQFVAVAAGATHSLALTADGVLYAWGCSRATPTPPPRCASPQPIDEGYATIAAGSWHSAGIKRDGSLWLWGSNESGQLGDGSGTAIGSGPRRLDP